MSIKKVAETLRKTDFSAYRRRYGRICFRGLYLHVPLIVAAVFISAALALLGDLRLGGVVFFWRGHRVGSLGNLHRFSVDGVGHSHCKVLL